MTTQGFSATLFAVLALTMLIQPSLAQETTGSLEGRIVDADGKPVAFANVNVTSPSLQGGRGVMSTSDGYFGVFKLPVGIYTVMISHVSYHEETYGNVRVHLGHTTTLRGIELKSKTFEAPTIVVTGKKVLIDVTTTTTGASLAREDFEVLPVERDYQEVPTLLPQVDRNFFGDGINYAGATGYENRYFVDGVDVTDARTGETGTRLPYNFMREVEVKIGGYEAEYRSSLGGAVNVVTHSGSNEYHGQVFGFFTSDKFTKEPKRGSAEPPETEFSNYDAGINIGGPVKQDKLWFFAAYNPTFEKVDIEAPGFGFQDDETITHIFSGKLTWRAAEKLNVALTGFGDPSWRDGVNQVGPGDHVANLDAVLTDRRSGGTAFSLQADYLRSDRTLFEFSVSRNDRVTRNEPVSARGASEPLFIDHETGVWSGGSGQTLDVSDAATTVSAKGTVILGDHTLKAGLEYKHVSTDVFEFFNTLDRFVDTTNTETYTSIITTTDSDVGNRIPSVFVQDSWQVHPRLRLNAGVRWDGQFIIDSNGDVAQKITDQYQPRAGFVYQPGEMGTQKVFGSYGRFYQEFGTAVSALYHSEGVDWVFIDYDHDPRVDPTGGVTWWTVGGPIHPEVDDLEGQHFDEFTLGYERRLGNYLKAGVMGTYRTLRNGVEDAWIDDIGEFRLGNPGKGLLTDYPEMKRDYSALVLTVERAGGKRVSFLASYVLSKTHGNYSGLFNQEYGFPQPNFNGDFDDPLYTENFDGLLPNDRTHRFKLSGSYRTDFFVTMGASLLWQSGTPKSIYEGPFLIWRFVEERGSSGRTPSIWDLNLRLAYDLPPMANTSLRPRLLLDIFHLGSQREVLLFDQWRAFDLDGTIPNPEFGVATKYQPPTSARLGMEVSF